MKRWYRFWGLLLLVVAEMERTDRHTHTHTTTIVTFAAHARRGYNNNAGSECFKTTTVTYAAHAHRGLIMQVQSAFEFQV